MLMMRKIDGEIGEDEEVKLNAHVATCRECAKEFDQYKRIAGATAKLAMKRVPPEHWDLYWAGVLNKLERSIAWIVVGVGALAVLASMIFRLVVILITTNSLMWWTKAGVLTLMVGMTWLFASVAREKMAMRKTDKYRGIWR